MSRRRLRPLVIPPDNLRCTRNDGRSWRCYSPRAAGATYCEKHRLAYCSKLSHPPHQNPNPSRSRVPQIGQIWAFSQHPDQQIPIHYVRIDRKIPNQQASSVYVTPLLPHPVLQEEFDKSQLLSCGVFRVTSKKPPTMMSTSVLVVRVTKFEVVNWMGITFYMIFPSKGEVWAVWSKGGGGDCKVVEVLSDFSEEEGVTVAGLVKGVGDDGEVYYERQLHEGFRLVQTYSRREMVMFSHRLAVSRVDGGGGEGGGDMQIWKTSSKSASQKHLLAD